MKPGANESLRPPLYNAPDPFIGTAGVKRRIVNMYLPQYFLSGLFELSCSTRPSLRLRVTSERLSRSSVPRKCKLSLSFFTQCQLVVDTVWL